MHFSEDAIDPRGFWKGKGAAAHHVFDPALAKALVLFFTEEKAQSIVDFGCGLGDYAKVLLDNGFDIQAYDGNPNTPELTGGVGHVLDLSQPFDLKRKFDWVLCLEVGEHVPRKYEEVFIDNLATHCIQGIVISWAVEGQGGYGHFNCRNNEYIKSAFEKRKCINDATAEQRLREEASLAWFKDTIMVFRKEGPSSMSST